MLLVFAHLLAAAMALGAIVATDLRLLSKLSQDRLRIAPPNEFVSRIVVVALLMLYVTGAGIVTLGVLDRPDYLGNPKLQAKLLLVALLTINAFVLHRLTFPRLARGRRLARWHASDWLVVAVPVGISNFLWMFVAFLGIARPWNYAMPLVDILQIAAVLYVVAQVGVFIILAIAGRKVEPGKKRLSDVALRWLASLGNLGRAPPVAPEKSSSKRHRSRPPRPVVADSLIGDTAASSLQAGDTPSRAPASEAFDATAAETSLSGRPALRLVGSRTSAGATRRRVR